MSTVKLLSIRKTKNNNTYKYIAKFLKTDRYGRKIEIYKHFGKFNEIAYSKSRVSNAKKLLISKYQQLSLKTKNPINTALLNMLLIKGKPTMDIKSYYNRHAVASFGFSPFSSKKSMSINEKLKKKGDEWINAPVRNRKKIQMEMVKLIDQQRLLSKDASFGALPLIMIAARSAPTLIRSAPTLVRAGSKKLSPYLNDALTNYAKDTATNILQPSAKFGGRNAWEKSDAYDRMRGGIRDYIPPPTPADDYSWEEERDARDRAWKEERLAGIKEVRDKYGVPIYNGDTVRMNLFGKNKNEYNSQNQEWHINRRQIRRENAKNKKKVYLRGGGFGYIEPTNDKFLEALGEAGGDMYKNQKLTKEEAKELIMLGIIPYFPEAYT